MQREPREVLADCDSGFLEIATNDTGGFGGTDDFYSHDLSYESKGDGGRSGGSLQKGNGLSGGEAGVTGGVEIARCHDGLRHSHGNCVLGVHVGGVGADEKLRPTLDADEVAWERWDDGSPGNGVDGEGGDEVFGICGWHLLASSPNPAE